LRVGIRAALITTILVTAAFGASCGSGGASASEPPTNGGFSGTSAVLYEYANTHCLRLGTASAKSHPTGSNPTIYAMKDAYPLAMIGTTKPHGAAEWRAAKDGCAVGIVRGFADAHSSKTAQVCTHMAPFLPPNLPECPGS
jgi:hypothetical protein